MQHLTTLQRYKISVMLEENFTQKAIAKKIDVSESTVSREIKRNRNGCGKYDPEVADATYHERMKVKNKHRRLDESMKILIRNKLSMDWSPEQIHGSCKRNGIDCVSHETIYKYIWEDKEVGGDLHTHLRRQGRRYRKRGSQYAYRGLIPNRVDIDERPRVVDEKERFGDLEGDLIIGKNHKGAVLTLNDRVSSLSWSAKLSGKNADEVAGAIIELLLPFKGYLHTLTFDNGREFAHHGKVSDALGINVYFAKPYHSWERGANENLNGLYRQYIPKKTDLSSLDPDDIVHARTLLNNRPRKKLGFLSPIQEICRIFASDCNFQNILKKVALVT